jgi:hypothetical protein
MGDFEDCLNLCRIDFEARVIDPLAYYFFDNFGQVV